MKLVIGMFILALSIGLTTISIDAVFAQGNPQGNPHGNPHGNELPRGGGSGCVWRRIL